MSHKKAVLVAEPPTGDRWLHEIKLDRFRMGVLVGGRGRTREVRIISRNGTDYTAAFPEIAEAATELPARAAVLDGEVVVLDERGARASSCCSNSGRPGAAAPSSRSTSWRSTART